MLEEVGSSMLGREGDWVGRSANEGATVCSTFSSIETLLAGTEFSITVLLAISDVDTANTLSPLSFQTEFTRTNQRNRVARTTHSITTIVQSHRKGSKKETRCLFRHSQLLHIRETTHTSDSSFPQSIVVPLETRGEIGWCSYPLVGRKGKDSLCFR